MGTAIENGIGTLKFYDPKKGFGFVSIPEVDDVRISAKVAQNFKQKLVSGANVSLSYVLETYAGKTGYNATRIHDVTPPAPPAPRPKVVEVLSTVTWFDKAKGFGFVKLAEGTSFSKQSAILRLNVCEKALFLPEENDILMVKVIERDSRGPEVTSFVHGPEVDDAWRTMMGNLHAEDGAVVEDEAVPPEVTEQPADAAEVVAVEVTADPVKPKAKQARAKKAKPVDIAKIVGQSGEGETAMAAALQEAARRGNGSAAHH